MLDVGFFDLLNFKRNLHHPNTKLQFIDWFKPSGKGVTLSDVDEEVAIL